MKVSDFDYNLPEHLIAQTPLLDRSSSRLLVYDRATNTPYHRHFSDIKEYLNPGDCLVLNNTRVIPARLLGNKPTGAQIELFLLSRIEGENDVWETMARPGKRLKEGDTVIFGNGILKATILKTLEDGNKQVRFEYEGIWQEVLAEVGIMPLPPYIHASLEDKERYQTVYSKIEGSSAAPTAGLHFTPELLSEIKEMGVTIEEITPHIGQGTFKPVKADTIEEHEMHTEYCIVAPEVAERINAVKRRGGRVIAVGTTATRTLESFTDDNGVLTSGAKSTSIFIYPGYKFKMIDALITNFHLPKSTLIMLISALAGRENILKVYEEAIAMEYRFFSFGDAMLII